ncbi:hypothetical protein PtrSN002B_008844 [Pyrenophora tritici-repentis]|nr:hypothetical protein PtrSN002B_008844 [Pyrenophora tritici-repentis]
MLALDRGRPVWYLLAFCTALFLLFSSCGFWTGRIFSPIEQYPDGLNAIFSTRTIDALNNDPRLRSALLSLTEAIALSSTTLGQRFRSDSLKNFGTNLTDGINHMRSEQRKELKKRSFFDEVGSFFGGLAGGGGSGARGGPSVAGLNSTGVLGDLLAGLGDSIGLDFTGGLDGILSSLDQPALFLGIGLGVGATTSLNLTDNQEAIDLATKIATANNASATGLNLIAQQLGSGLTSAITPSLSNNTNFSFSPAAYALASGIGNATAKGLGLSTKQYLPSNVSSIEAIAGNIGLGVTGPIVANIDFQALLKSAGGSMIMQQLPQIAAAAGMGLGEGARDGLGLTSTSAGNPGIQKRQTAGDSSTDTAFSEAVGLFAKGLSRSFVGGSNFSMLATGTSLTDLMNLKAMLQPLFAGAGAGLGAGVAIGLGFKAANSKPILGTNMTGDNEQTAMAAESFTQNLLANFLMNSTALQQAQKLITDSPASVFQNVDPAKAAEGFARGTIEGFLSALASVGGINNLINGTIPANAIDNVPVLKPTRFNDSVNGSAVGFARGLTGKGTILLAQIARNLTQGSQDATDPAPGQKRSERAAEEVSVGTGDPLSARQLEGMKINRFAISATTAELAAQKAIDTLTCSGVGGLASAALGIMSAIKADPNILDMMAGDESVPLDGAVLRALPQGQITLFNAGNNFEVVIRDASVKVNGLDLVPFAVVTALHILFAAIAFLLLLPLYLSWGAAWRFSVIAGYPIDEAKNLKWRFWFLISFSIFGIIAIILGIVGIGNSTHFRDAHSIIGLIAFIFLFPTVGFTIVRLRTDLPLPPPSSFSGYKGPLALAKTPQRIYLISGISTQLLLTLGQLVVLQGFSTLRSVSLCVIDAFFDSIAATTVVSIILMVQISATAIVGFRAWLEQHIAKSEAAGEKRSSFSSLRQHKRSDTMATFGFDRKEPPPKLDLTASRPRLPTWEANALKGEEQIGISTPFNILKDGSIHERDSRASPFISAEEQQHYHERGIYTPKTGGYVPGNTRANGLTPPVPIIPFAPRSAGLPTRSMLRPSTLTSSAAATPHALTFNPIPTPRTAGLTTSNPEDDIFTAPAPYAENRPSSDIFETARSPLLPRGPLTPMHKGPKTTDVHTSDLWPPPVPTIAIEPSRTTMIQEPRTVAASPGWTTPTSSSIATRSIRASFIFPAPTPAPLAIPPKTVGSGPKTINVSTSDLFPPPLPELRQMHPGNEVNSSLSSSSSFGGADYVFPKQTNVTTADLWPPPNPAYERIAAAQREQLQSQIEARGSASETSGEGGVHRKKGSKDSAKKERESRVMDGNVPVRDSFMGFDNGR